MGHPPHRRPQPVGSGPPKLLGVGTQEVQFGDRAQQFRCAARPWLTQPRPRPQTPRGPAVARDQPRLPVRRTEHQPLYLAARLPHPEAILDALALPSVALDCGGGGGLDRQIRAQAPLPGLCAGRHGLAKLHASQRDRRGSLVRGRQRRSLPRPGAHRARLPHVPGNWSQTGRRARLDRYRRQAFFPSASRPRARHLAGRKAQFTRKSFIFNHLRFL